MKGESSSAVKITGVIVFGILVLTLFVILAMKSFVPYAGETVDVQGVSEVTTTPDIIGVYYSVETVADSQAEATEINAEAVQSLRAYLEEADFDLDDLTTENFNVRENYNWENGRNSQEDYIAVHGLKLEIQKKDKNKIGEVIDIGVSVGASVNYISYELSQRLENQLKAEAIEIAAEDARIKAEAVAKGFGKRVGKLVSVDVLDWGYYPWRTYDSAASGGEFIVEEAKQATEISPGMKKVSATVRAQFELK